MFWWIRIWSLIVYLLLLIFLSLIMRKINSHLKLLIFQIEWIIIKILIHKSLNRLLLIHQRRFKNKLTHNTHNLVSFVTKMKECFQIQLLKILVWRQTKAFTFLHHNYHISIRFKIISKDFVSLLIQIKHQLR